MPHCSLAFRSLPMLSACPSLPPPWLRCGCSGKKAGIVGLTTVDTPKTETAKIGGSQFRPYNETLPACSEPLRARGERCARCRV